MKSSVGETTTSVRLNTADMTIGSLVFRLHTEQLGFILKYACIARDYEEVNSFSYARVFYTDYWFCGPLEKLLYLNRLFHR